MQRFFTFLLIGLFSVCSFLSIAQTTPYTGKYDEPYRPQFHFTPQQKWMNDPNGLVYLNGKYHLFYQYYPNDIVWGPMHWGHATSKDLIHWEHQPIALYPDSLGMIFSGSAVIDKNNTAGFGKNAMVAIFTYHSDEIYKQGWIDMESQGLAYSLDAGKTWTKYAKNPVLPNPKPNVQDFRDPKVFWNEETKLWTMSLAVGQFIRFYTSPNLKDWQHTSDFKPQEDFTLGVWECPDLFKLKVEGTEDEKWVLIVNHGDKAPNGGSGTRYFVGKFDGKTFTAETKGLWLDYGTDFYAGVTFDNHPKGKRVLIAWMSNWQYAQKTPTEVWRSAMTLPRELNLIKYGDSYLLTQSVVEVGKLSNKKGGFYKNKVRATKEKDFVADSLDLSQAEIYISMVPDKECTVELSNAKGEVFAIHLKEGKIITDRSKSGLTDFSDKFALPTQVMPTSITHQFYIFVDKSSVEILLDGGKFSMTNQVFPTEKYTTLKIKTPYSCNIYNIRINSLKSIWKK
jgi:fructan beta-fructosidase